jgi:multiple sugar transport system substrate-binding protein
VESGPAMRQGIQTKKEVETVKSVKFMVLAVAVFLTFTAASAFAGGQGENAGARIKGQPPISVLINSSPWLNGFKALVAQYQQETGNQVNLDVTPFPGMLQKSRNAVTAPTSEFDLINLNEEWYQQFYKGGLVTPLKQIDPKFSLDPQVIEYDYADRWDPKANLSTKEGEIYGLPINGNIQILFYRTDLFEQKGLKPPATFDELLNDAKVFHDPPNVYGFITRTSDDPSFNYMAYLHGFGGQVVSYDGKTRQWSVDIAKKPALDALNFWLNMAWTFDPPDYAKIDQAAMISLMASGKTAMVIMVDAAASNFNDPKVSTVIGKVGAVVTPGLTPDMHAPTSGIWVMGIPHNLPMERKKAALAFLQWSMTQKAETVYAEAGGIVVRNDVYKSLAQNPKFWWAKAVADSTPYIQPFPRVSASSEIHLLLNDLLRQAVAKQIDPAAMLSQAAQKIHALMTDAGYPMMPLGN